MLSKLCLNRQPGLEQLSPYLQGFVELKVEFGVADLGASTDTALATILSICVCQNSLCCGLCNPVLIDSNFGKDYIYMKKSVLKKDGLEQIMYLLVSIGLEKWA